MDLTALLLAQLPVPKEQCVDERSFPLTAAGQSRIYTGFPIKPIRHEVLDGTDEINISGDAGPVNPAIKYYR